MPPGQIVSTSGDQWAERASANEPRRAACSVSSASRRRARVSAATSSCAWLPVASTASDSFVRAWLNRLRTVPTGTPHSSAICS
jgi:hypothetical protein